MLFGHAVKSLISSKKQIVVICYLLFGCSSAFAINIQQTRRSGSLTYERLDDTRTFNSHVTNDYRWILTAGYSYVDSPLVVKNSFNSDSIETLIKNLNGLHLGGSYYFKDWLALDVETAFNQFTDNNKDQYTGFSDPQLKIRLRLVNKNNWAFAVAPFVNINLNQGEFSLSNVQTNTNLNGMNIAALSDTGLGLGIKFIGEYLADSFQLTGNLGFQYSDGAIDKDISGVIQLDYRSTILFGLGVYLPIYSSWGLNFEFQKQFPRPIFNSDQGRNEFFSGLGWAINKRLHSYAGMAFGNLFQDNDGNDYRFSTGIKLIGYSGKAVRRPLNAIVKDYDNNIFSIKKEKPCSPYIWNETNIAVIRFSNNNDVVSFGDKQAGLNALNRLQKFKKNISKIALIGHTSSRGNDLLNKSLAQKRADSVFNELIKLGIEKNIIVKESKGETELLVNDQSILEKDEYPNRRAELIVEPIDGAEFCD